jgi:O-antigen/teichoic acid export membrane protein
VKELIAYIKGIVLRDGKSDQEEILGDSFWTIIIKVVAVGGSFISSLILARELGPSSYGVYSFVLSLVGLGVVFVSLGIPRLIVREVSAYRENNNWPLIYGLLKWSFSTEAVVVICVVVVAWIAIKSGIHVEDSWIYYYGILLLALKVFDEYFRMIVRAFDPVYAQLPTGVIRPVAFLVALSIASIFGALTASFAVILRALSVLLAFVLVIRFAVALLPASVWSSRPKYRKMHWAKSSMRFLLIGGLFIIQKRVDIAMMGFIGSSEETGIYKVAARASETIVFFLSAADMVLEPYISKIYTSGDMQQMQKVITDTTRGVFILSLPIAALFILKGEWVLGLFGEGYSSGYTALCVLSIGHLVNAAAGSVGLYLSMTKNEADTAWATGIAGVANVCLNILLIPEYGAEGAAIATCVTLTIWNLVMSYTLYKRTGVYATIIGKL